MLVIDVLLQFYKTFSQGNSRNQRIHKPQKVNRQKVLLLSVKVINQGFSSLFDSLC